MKFAVFILMFAALWVQAQPALPVAAAPITTAPKTFAVDFYWTAVSGARGYVLNYGSQSNALNLKLDAGLKTNASVTVSNLPIYAKVAAYKTNSGSLALGTPSALVGWVTNVLVMEDWQQTSSDLAVWKTAPKPFNTQTNPANPQEFLRIQRRFYAQPIGIK